MSRVYLSPPEIGGLESEFVAAAIDSNWIAPVGPDLDAFEREVAERVGRRHAVGLSSGTAAIHLGLMELGVGPGDHVIVSTLTFAASANPIVYLGAQPILVDSDAETWNMSPALLEDALRACAQSDRVPKAAVVVDIYGQCAEYAALLPIFEKYGVAVLEDAAEALGASCDGQPAGSFGACAVLSFNGNKIITTSGGGMLVCDDDEFARRIRFFATQAREDAPHYEHREIGFNYRLSNVLAALGRAQLADLDRRVERRRDVNRRYREGLADAPGVAFMPEAPFGHSTNWLTCITIDPDLAHSTTDDVRLWLESHDVESRPAWKPLHLQPAFAEAPRFVDGTSQQLFERGLCLPSGSSLTPDVQDRVIALLRERLDRPA